MAVDAHVVLGERQRLAGRHAQLQLDEIDPEDQNIVAAVEYLLNNAFDNRASDIHIEPKREVSKLRLRIDGILHDVGEIPAAVHPAFVARIKILARMDIAEKRRPQDGRIKTQRGDGEIELRVSSLPVAFGEKVKKPSKAEA